MIRFALLGLLLVRCMSACGAADGRGNDSSLRGGPDRPRSCPATVDAPPLLPGVETRHRELSYWLGRTETYGDLDTPLLTPQEIRDHNRGTATDTEDRPRARADLLAPVDSSEMLGSINERLTAIREGLNAGNYVHENGSRFTPQEIANFNNYDRLPAVSSEYHVALGQVAIRCGPFTGSYYSPSLDLRFDRNNCSGARAQELVQVLYRLPNGIRVARTSYTLGFIGEDAPLSPAIGRDSAAIWIDGPHAMTIREATLREGDATATVASGTLLPLAPGESSRVRFASNRGVHTSGILSASDIQGTERSLTRRAVLSEAFRLLDAPYGWGDEAGGRDCSRFLLDVFESFGLRLPRHSAHQAHAGTFSIDVSELRNEREKLLLIESAAQKGIVLLQFPGHIMMYLGRTEAGTPMAIHAFAEYLEPCVDATADDGTVLETLVKVDRITVSNLELGRSTSRTAFIERISRITVIGKGPGIELGGVATLRPAAAMVMPEADACDDSIEVAVFRSPARPNSNQPLRVIVTSERDPGPGELVLVDPNGEVHRPSTHRLGPPPWTHWAEIAQPAAGQWTAAFGDGETIEACETFTVYPQRSGATRSRSNVAWEPRWRWERDTENLFAAFIEQLFLEGEEDMTWHGMQVLIADPSRNLLHDHLSLGEDDSLRLEPDCADLPYTLRAYFAWKSSLPFGFRSCNRGDNGRPPNCGPALTNMDEMEPMGDLAAGRDFLRRVAGTVHSASARTHPSDDDTDVYPVALTRESLRPGTVFADPYGHLLVVARWIPQGMNSYGILMGADAQPDGTIGRRRFWQGTFLFTPDTTDVGAGFKAWRPLVYGNGSVVPVHNDALRTTTAYPQFSLEQYQGTAENFYDRMEALINPRPLDAEALLVALVDALEESIIRRITSVENGEQYLAQHRGTTIDMPTGYDVFETTGAWEDYSTPSRDMRLLISIDAVTGFPNSVERGPERFALGADDLGSTIARLRTTLTRELGSRSFSYTRSDGSSQTLTLADVVARAPAFEMAYNPNDCPEIRWGASEGTPEYSTCRRHAPAIQLARMREYRSWFHERRRPPR